MTCAEFYIIALPTIIITAIASVVNTFAQLYDIYWCRWHHCGKSSKNSTKSVVPSEDYPTQSVGALPTDFTYQHIKES